jgi:hypothetical protein
MKELSVEVWEKLEEKISRTYPLLIFHDILDDEEIKDQELPLIDNNTSIYVYQHKRFDNVFAVGTKYTRMFSYRHPDRYVQVDAVIDYVSLRKGQEIFSIPEGYGGLCRIHFPNGLPKEINLVPKGTNTKFDREKNDILYLTTENVLNPLLEILNE